MVVKPSPSVRAPRRRRQSSARPLLDLVLTALAMAVARGFDLLSWGPAFRHPALAILALLRPPRPVRLEGVPEAGALLLISGHGSGWEDAAAALAHEGRSVLAVVAPWPRLPRLHRFLRHRRAERGVATVERGFAGSRAVIRHLAGGGTALLLVDTLRPRGGRVTKLPHGAVRPPDGAIGFAVRSGAVVGVAGPSPSGWGVTRTWRPSGLSRTERRAVADAAGEALGTLMAAEPRRWLRLRPVTPAWIVGAVLGASHGGCVVEETPGPWPGPGTTFELEGVRWTGPVGPGSTLHLLATHGQVVGSAAGPAQPIERADGALFDVRFELLDAAGHPVLTGQATSLSGRWPSGPGVMESVRWERGPGSAGRADRLEVDAEGRIGCGGCPLDGWKVGDPPPEGLGADSEGTP